MHVIKYVQRIKDEVRESRYLSYKSYKIFLNKEIYKELILNQSNTFKSYFLNYLDFS